MKNEIGQLARFCVVGLTNTLLTLAVFLLLTRAGMASPAASAIGFCAGAANGFFLNRTWTFRTERRDARMIARYVAVQLLGAALSAGGVALGRAGLDAPRLVAEALVLPFVTLTTFGLSRRLVFTSPGLV